MTTTPNSVPPTGWHLSDLTPEDRRACVREIAECAACHRSAPNQCWTCYAATLDAS